MRAYHSKCTAAPSERRLKRDLDVLIIGAGIAGASVASRLAGQLRTGVIEKEAQAGYHSTGRSAAIFSAIYGGAAVRALSRATRLLLDQPPAGFSARPLHKPRGGLFIAADDQLERLEAFAAQPDVSLFVRRVTPEEAYMLVPVLRRDTVAAGLLEPGATEIDVHALHQGFIRKAKAGGCEFFMNAEALTIDKVGDRWHVETAAGAFTADVIVNAAGAWANSLANQAGAAPINIEPRRRTIVVVKIDGIEVENWPMTIDIDERFYFKPEVGRLLLSAADETLSPPCDCQPEEWDIAIAIDRIQAATSLRIDRVEGKWAGLRNFAPDREPVIGFDPHASGFFWLAGQGGYGIQTSEGAAVLSEALIRGHPVPQYLCDLGFEPMAISPDRFAAPRKMSRG